MKPLSLVSILLLACSLAGCPSQETARVSGRDLVDTAESLRANLLRVGFVPTNDEEARLFVQATRKLVNWVRENRETWHATSEFSELTEAEYARIASLKGWKRAGVAFPDYYALFMKFTTAKTYAGKELETELERAKEKRTELKKELEELGTGGLSDSARRELQRAVQLLDSQIEGMENFDPENIAVYERHREEIDASLQSYLETAG